MLLCWNHRYEMEILLLANGLLLKIGVCGKANEMKMAS